jgi:hypothetical protein
MWSAAKKDLALGFPASVVKFVLRHTELNEEHAEEKLNE